MFVFCFLFLTHCVGICLLIGIFRLFASLLICQGLSLPFIYLFSLFLVPPFVLFWVLRGHFWGFHDLFIVVLSVSLCIVFLVVALHMTIHISDFLQSAGINILPLHMKCGQLTAILVPLHFPVLNIIVLSIRWCYNFFLTIKCELLSSWEYFVYCRYHISTL